MGDIEDIGKLLLAVLCGALIGFEREYRDKAAGLRVVPMVSLGAALVTILSGANGERLENPHVAASVITGVGFLGAGVILQDRGKVIGMTTAATIWVAAAIGMACGKGQYLLTGFTTSIALLILWVMPHFDIYQVGREEYTYEIIAPFDLAQYEVYHRRFLESGVRVLAHTISRQGEDMVVIWRVEGKQRINLHLAREFLADSNVKECTIS